MNDQFFFGALCCALGLGILGTMLLHRNRQLKASETAFVTPEGTEVPFASSFRIDKRKWANKGLAYVHYRDATGRERRAVIDDLKYEGAERVLARLMEHFQGEILDRVDETEGGLDEHDESDTAPGSDVIQTERSRDGDGSFVEPKSPGDRR